jgi:tRNA-dihydrouridine synthase A
MLNRLISVAPMLHWTDRHERFFLRQITHHSLLYTEMVTTGAILLGDHHYLLGYDPIERPLALQLGGREPRALAHCARIAEKLGYDEVNLNVGCPSDRSQSGGFGACLMAKPELVSRCVAAMREAVEIPVTVKTRIGIDEQDSYEGLAHFVDCIAAAGCQVFVIHARKAWLKGLSPRENRQLPPLRYEIVHRVKADFPHLQIILNGGLDSLDKIAAHLDDLDGVMIGRAAYQNPYLLAEVDRRFYGDHSPPPSQHEVTERFMRYVAKQLCQGVPLAAMTRHILGLFAGQAGARIWRHHLSLNAHRSGAGVQVIEEALQRVTELAQNGRPRCPT